MTEKTAAYAVERWALAQKLGPKKHAHKLLLVTLAITADASGYCWPSQSLLATQCELSRQTVNKHVAWLAANTYIAKRARQTTSGRETSCEYVVLFRENLAWPDGTPVRAPRSARTDGGSRQAVSRRDDRVGREDTTASVGRTGHLEETGGEPREETTERADASTIEADDGLYGLRNYIEGLGQRGILKPEWADQDFAKPDWQSAWRAYVQAQGTEQVAADLRLLFAVIDDLARPEIVRTYRKGQEDWSVVLRGPRSVLTFVANAGALRATVERFQSADVQVVG